MKPKFFESREHRAAFQRKIEQWHCENDPERFAALYILLSDPNIRDNQEFILLDELRIIDADSTYEDSWITAADRDLMSIAMSCYNGKNLFSAQQLMNDYSAYALEGLRLLAESCSPEHD